MAFLLRRDGWVEGDDKPRNMPIAQQLCPDVEWLDQRSAVDGKLWASGRAGAGIDMTATYLLEIFDNNLVNTLAIRMLDFDPKVKRQHYQEALSPPKTLFGNQLE